ncbi:hypothetical protein [Larkinella arboricola]
MKYLPELSNFLKYGIMGFAALALVLSFVLIQNEQRKKRHSHSTVNLSYSLMVLSFLFFIFGLFAPNKEGHQQSENSFQNSNGNKVTVRQRGDTTNQSSKNTYIDSDSNDVNIDQASSTDTVRLD